MFARVIVLLVEVQRTTNNVLNQKTKYMVEPKHATGYLPMPQKTIRATSLSAFGVAHVRNNCLVIFAFVVTCLPPPAPPEIFTRDGGRLSDDASMSLTFIDGDRLPEVVATTKKHYFSFGSLWHPWARGS